MSRRSVPFFAYPDVRGKYAEQYLLLGNRK